VSADGAADITFVLDGAEFVAARNERAPEALQNVIFP
jgi:hypothetical protein